MAGIEEAGPQPESLRSFIAIQWADIHHSRVQEWSALGVVTGAQLAIVQAPKLIADVGIALPPVGVAIGGLVAAVAFSIVGMLLTLRHRHLMQVKFNWIADAERALGLVRTESNPLGVIPDGTRMPSRRGTSGLSWPRALSTSGMIVALYALFILGDVLLAALIITQG